MSGIFGAYSIIPDPGRVKRVLTSLEGLDGMRVSRCADAAGLLMGGSRQLTHDDALSHHAGRDCQVVMHGSMSGRGACRDAEAVAKRYGLEGVAGLLGKDGHYAIALWDIKLARLWVFADPLGSIPICYKHEPGTLAFGAQAKVVFRLMESYARIDRDSALQFLMNRYLIGARTMFEGVYRLGPGESLCYEAERDRLHIDRYWDLKYVSRIHRLDEGADGLHEILVASHRDMLAELETGERYQLFLTGGMDSRGILGMTAMLGRPPDQALTWASRDGVEHSDPEIGRRLAQQYGVSFDVPVVEGAGWAKHAKQWCRISELLSDNASSFAMPSDVYSAWQNERMRFVVLGDQAFGAGSVPSCPQHAVDSILGSALSTAEGPLRRILHEESRREAIQGFQDEIAGLVASGPNSEPKDIQDYLYFHTYIAKWILAPGNFKSPMLPVRRPLMTRSIMDLVSQLGPLLRVDKTAYLQMLARHYPELGRQPVTSVDSGVDWPGVMRSDQRLQDFLLARLSPHSLNKTVLDGDIDTKGLGDFAMEFFRRRTSMTSRGHRFRRHLYDLRRHLSRSQWLGQAAHFAEPVVKRLSGMQMRQQVSHEYQLIMRLVLLGLLQECLEEGAFDAREVGER